MKGERGLIESFGHSGKFRARVRFVIMSRLCLCERSRGVVMCCMGGNKNYTHGCECLQVSELGEH